MEDYFDCIYECGRVVVVEWFAIYGVEVGGGVFDGGFSGDICVHGLSVAGEETSTWGRVSG
jgi:hypothetical protein